ncbi:TIGR03905 family TSCPD domain-containing protein [Sedimentibacter sp. zth1]|uniref:TIGR03905 family TSCPD domain-containing protein n=1 Tax=Sedimentibacter sp. zth1 TaxID=2816908 RepID=UPI001A90F10F|nr:TIGR03905 family TSCPD domain-containing protein [Sedimentibacter sp. zth1]QSX04692.1 TIGR03905 family TSCPD domain-containing protein [Sedimentibacter sp. zth1]
MYRYKTHGVCSREISFDVKDNKLTDVSFVGGCIGNLRGISILVDGMDIDLVIEKFKNVKCGKKSTSCPAQLAKALEEYKEKATVK